MQIRDRVVKLIKVKASELKPNPWNFRMHPDKQREAFRGLMKEIGFAGAVLVRQLKNGEYTLIDGHLRREEFGDRKISALVVDLTEKEARKLLAAYDPLSALAETDQKALGKLLREVETGDTALANLFSELAEGSQALDPDELELDVDGDDEAVAAEGVELKASHVRMVQLFLNIQTLPLFEKYVKTLGKLYHKTTVTDVVMECMKRACRKAKRKELAAG